MPRASDSTQLVAEQEWVDITNSTRAVNLNGWALRDEDGHTFTFRHVRLDGRSDAACPVGVRVPHGRWRWPIDDYGGGAVVTRPLPASLRHMPRMDIEGHKRARHYVDGLRADVRETLRRALSTRPDLRTEERARLVGSAIAEAFPGGLTEAERRVFTSVKPWDTVPDKLLRTAGDSHAARREEAMLKGMSCTERLQYKAERDRGWYAGNRVSRHY